MKRLVLFFVLLFWVQPVFAKTHYITDIVKITLRTGPGVDHRVMAMVKSGQPVEVIRPDDEWTLIRLPDGKEGWVLSRLLSTETPVVVLYDQLKEKYEALEKKMKAPSEIIQRLENEKTELAARLEAEKQAHEATKAAGPAARDPEADRALEKLKQEYNQLSQRYAQLEKQVSAKSKKKGLFGFLDERMIWFLIGGAVLLVGFLLGSIAKRGRRRSTIYS